MAMRNRQQDLQWFGLPVLQSSDGGVTWSFLSQLDTNANSGGRFDRGLWEPFLYELPNGCIAGFYANEKHADENPAYSQIISEKVSCDGGNSWGSEIFAVAEPGNSRPGMPGFTQMKNGKFILVFEVCGTRDCDVFYKISEDGITWPEGLGISIPKQRSGPFVTSLSDGLVVVSSGGTNVISISPNFGKTWFENIPPAFFGETNTWPGIYQVGYLDSKEIGVVVNFNGTLTIAFGKFH
jgi:hypothetical protein